MSDKYYLKNTELAEEVRRCKEAGQISLQLFYNFELLVGRISRKPEYRGYSYLEDMQSAALGDLVANWAMFNPDYSDKPNPFAYYTTIVVNCFKTYLRKESKQQRVKDALLIEHGLNPSWNFKEEIEE